ncbi:MAG: lysostaphin resistance A-like protein [Rhodanobacter sp.]
MPLFAVLWSVVLTLLLFLAAYVPAFMISSALHLSLEAMVPEVIAVSLVVVCTLMGIAIWRRWLSSAEFGWRWPSARYVVYALTLAVPLSALVAWILSRVAEPGPLAGLHLSSWQAYIYFALAAPVQEEVIFRGLLQSTLAKSLASVKGLAVASGLIASLVVAALFGVIHLKVGPVTASAALLLGVLAGELKRGSGSLLPGMLCHAIFNLGGLVWVTH